MWARGIPRCGRGFNLKAEIPPGLAAAREGLLSTTKATKSTKEEAKAMGSRFAPGINSCLCALRDLCGSIFVYDEFLRQKVDAARALMRVGRGRSNDEVEAAIAARRALQAGEDDALNWVEAISEFDELDRSSK
jgi:hypothetical protein